MPNARILLPLAILALVTACLAIRPTDQAPSVAFDIQDKGLFEAARTYSCAADQSFLPAQSIEISATPVTPDHNDDWAGALGNVEFAGLWHLESTEPNFGGLSGLAFESAGNLLAVSDQGAFITIPLRDGAPAGDGSIGYMRQADGDLLSGKDTSDSEGLHLADGLAFVSFERNHRISAFDLSGCGVAAREVVLARVPTDRSLNQGLEALTILAGQMVGGWEKTSRNKATLQRFELSSGRDTGQSALRAPRGLNLTGLDQASDQIFAVFRAYSPLKGNTIEVRKYTDLAGEGETLVRLQRPLPVDNFEGIAATQMDDGTIRVYIVSDDNFSANQRTLLMAFDVIPSAP